MLTVLFTFPAMNCKKGKIAPAFVTYQYYHKQNLKNMQNLTKTDLAISKIGVFYCREMDLKKK